MSINFISWNKKRKRILKKMNQRIRKRISHIGRIWQRDSRRN